MPGKKGKRPPNNLTTVDLRDTRYWEEYKRTHDLPIRYMGIRDFDEVEQSIRNSPRKYIFPDWRRKDSST